MEISLFILYSFLETSNDITDCDNSKEHTNKRISYSVDQILKIGEMHKEMLLKSNFRVGTTNKHKEKINRHKRYQKAKKVIRCIIIDSSLKVF